MCNLSQGIEEELQSAKKEARKEEKQSAKQISS